MKTKALLASLAVSSLVLAQPAAAATRSYESIPAAGVQASANVDRAGAAIGENEDVRGRGLWMVFAALGLSVLLVILLTGDKSPG